MRDLLPYLCPFADCNLKDRMWGVRSEWETHLNHQHPIPNAQGGDTKQYAFTCKICRRTFHSDDHGLEKDSNSPFFTFRNSHYGDHMERIASSVVNDHGPASSACKRKQSPKSHVKRRRKNRTGSELASGHDSSPSARDTSSSEEAMSGWSSEGSTGSQG